MTQVRPRRQFEPERAWTNTLHLPDDGDPFFRYLRRFSAERRCYLSMPAECIGDASGWTAAWSYFDKTYLTDEELHRIGWLWPDEMVQRGFSL